MRHTLKAKTSTKYAAVGNPATKTQSYTVDMKKLHNYRDGDIFLYLLSVVPFFLCANAKIDENVMGLALGLYVALIYCRCNFFLISPMYIAGCALADASVVGLVYAISPVVFLGCAKALHYAFAKPLNMISANVFACISLMPVFIFDLGVHQLPYVLTSIILNQVFCYCATVICYALIVRGIRNKLSTDEIAGGAICLTVTALGLYRLDIFGFMPYFLILGWTVMACTHSFSLSAGTLICFAIGAGGSAAAIDLSVCAAAVAMLACANAFKKLGIWFSFAAVMLVDLLSGVFFEAYTYDLLHPIALAIGAGAFAILPRKVRAKMPVYITEDGSAAAKQMVKHNRSEVFARLTGVAKVFYEMGDCFGYRPSRSFADKSPAETVAREVMLRTCASCPSRASCQAALGSDTGVLFEGAASIALSGGRISGADLPTFINARCIRIPALLSNCVESVSDFNKRKENEKQYELSQQIVAEQMYGVGRLISDLADDVNRGVNFDATLEQKLVEELSYFNIVCTEAVMYSKNAEFFLNLTVRADDVQKRALDEIVDKVLGCRMKRKGSAQPLGGGKAALSFCTEPKYGAIYGEATARKDGSSENGDVKSVQKLGDGKLFFAVCDGMGSGDDAHEGSSATLNMVENFYKAGFEGDSVLNMINRLLMLRSKDSFSALDMCVIDLKRAIAHFVKLGGVQSFIKRADNVEIVNSSALPIGIVEEAVPFTDNKLLSPGDVVMLVSDGIVDSLGADGISLILSRSETVAPQELCDIILAQATKRGAKDDSTAIAVRLV